MSKLRILQGAAVQLQLHVCIRNIRGTARKINWLSIMFRRKIAITGARHNSTTHPYIFGEYLEWIGRNLRFQFWLLGWTWTNFRSGVVLLPTLMTHEHIVTQVTQGKTSWTYDEPNPDLFGMSVNCHEYSGDLGMSHGLGSRSNCGNGVLSDMKSGRMGSTLDFKGLWARPWCINMRRSCKWHWETLEVCRCLTPKPWDSNFPIEFTEMCIFLWSLVDLSWLGLACLISITWFHLQDEGIAAQNEASCGLFLYLLWIIVLNQRSSWNFTYHPFRSIQKQHKIMNVNE